MTEKEKIIKGLECCELYNKDNCDNCPYNYNGRGNWKSECTAELATDVLELLKEQNDNIGHWVVLKNCSNEGVYCSECKTKIVDHYPVKKKYSYFCPHCGTRMEGPPVCTFPTNIAALNQKEDN